MQYILSQKEMDRWNKAHAELREKIYFLWQRIAKVENKPCVQTEERYGIYCSECEDLKECPLPKNFGK